MPRKGSEGYVVDGEWIFGLAKAKARARRYAKELRRTIIVEDKATGKTVYKVGSNPAGPTRNNWKAGKWIKASAVRVRKVAGRVVMDIKKAI